MHGLRDTTEQIEADMHDTEEVIRREEQEIGHLRGRLRHLSSTDSLYVSGDF